MATWLGRYLQPLVGGTIMKVEAFEDEGGQLWPKIQVMMPSNEIFDFEISRDEEGKRNNIMIDLMLKKASDFEESLANSILSQNQKRVARASFALFPYYEGEHRGLTEAVVDLLTDLRHWCADNQVSGNAEFDWAVDVSKDHFLMENIEIDEKSDLPPLPRP